MSVFSWLDYSDAERRRMLDVISTFAEKGTVDELGLGTVRDAYADLLFPGTSTVMTRARYYLLVPWIYQRLEQRGIDSSRFGAEAKKAEIALIEALSTDDPTADGIIGVRSRKDLKRLPSNIYWAGLHTWGIRRFEGSQTDYHRSVDAIYAERKQQHSRRDVRGDEHCDFSNEAWHPNTSLIPETFPREASLRLSCEEAEYLQHRIRTAPATCKSLLSTLITAAEPLPKEGMIWDHPGFTERRWPAAQLEQVEHAQRFSEVMHGATLLYHRLLRQQKEIEDAELDDAIEEWIKTISIAKPVWDYRTRFWEIARQANPRLGIASAPTTSFVLSWIQLVERHSPKGVLRATDAKQLITQREQKLKGKLARLTNSEALKRWNGINTPLPMDLRWGITRRLLTDIIGGLHAYT